MTNLVFSKVNGIQKWGGKAIFRSLLTIALFSQASTIVKADDTEGSVGVPSTTTSITVGDLAGIAPSKDVCTTDKPTNNNNKIFFLYNIGTGKFLSPGGFWGTHTSLSDVGFKMWLEANNDGKYDSFNIRTTLMTEDDKEESEVYRYVKYNDKLNSLYMDHNKSVNDGYTNNYAWTFEPVTDNGYTENSHVYRLYTKNADGTKTIYMTANPTNSYPNYVTGQGKQVDKNQYWKLISLYEYYTLFAKTPAQLKSPTDATFLLKDPSFHVNNAYIKNWEIQNNEESFRFGGTKCYKTLSSKEGYKDYLTYQQNDGLYFFAFSENGNNDGIRQIVPVHQPGWYIFDCNGFSSANKDTTNVMLYVTPTTDLKGETTKWDQAHATPLNVVSDEEAKSLMENESDNIGNNTEAKVNGEVAAGKAFAEGKYENQVMFYVEEASEDKPAYLQFGINIAKHDVKGTEWTAFGDFRMYYAGERTENTPDLILDEEKNDLSYLTTTTNEDYNNVTLHLNRTFTLGKWNTLVLPVNLTYGQMKKAFGDGIKLAKLWKLTDKSIQFKTVECSKDDEQMLNAFEPYIIQVFNGKDVTPAYTATLTKKDNAGTVDVTIEKDHYDISMVSLKRSDIEQNVHIEGDANSEKGKYNWTSKFTGEGTTGTGTPGTLTCYSSMGKTYALNTSTGKKTILTDKGYDKLAGAYFMKNGDLWKVPSDKQYGMQAFRCWFRLTENTDKDTDKPSPAKEAKIWLDGVVEDNSTTSIDDIIFDDPFDTPTTYKATENAIYNLNGQLIRQGTSTEGLPSGIYVVAGRKVMIK